ncbi:MAG: transporter [Methylibium sp.]|nr:transporter [Methylibium sp.]
MNKKKEDPAFRPWPDAGPAHPGRAARRSKRGWAAHAAAALLLAMAASAQGQAAAPALTLEAAAQAAIQRLPQTQAASHRSDAAEALRRASERWTPEAPTLETSLKSDRVGSKAGERELSIGLAVPLWLPGERAASRALAEAELAGLAPSQQAAAWLTVAELRAAWWALHSARNEQALMRARLAHAEQLAADVAKRVRAGDLARADQHQADGAVAAAQMELAQAQAAQVQAGQSLQALIGPLPAPGAEARVSDQAEVAPDAAEALDPAAALQAHPLLRELAARAEIAQRSAALNRVQTRASPELSLSTARDRGAFGEPYGQALTLALRLPLGAGERYSARQSAALAELAEAQAQLSLARERIAAEVQAAQGRAQLARVALQAAERRAQLADEAQGFFEKSFRLGQADLPTRLRVALEAFEAQRQALRARIELAQAVSQWRQALGLLPAAPTE